MGLAAEGEDGVARVLAELQADTAHVLALCGAADCTAPTRDQVVVRGPHGVAGC